MQIGVGGERKIEQTCSLLPPSLLSSPPLPLFLPLPHTSPLLFFFLSPLLIEAAEAEGYSTRNGPFYQSKKCDGGALLGKRCKEYPEI